MKRRHVISLLLAGGIGLLPDVCLAIADDNPYKNIVDRNSFALVSPPPPAPITNTPPPANIKLTGITTVLGRKRALLMVQDTSGPGKPDLSCILSEEEQTGQVQVLEIDEKAGSVRVKNGEVVSVLSFDQHGIKLAGLPVPPPAPGGAPGRPTANVSPAAGTLPGASSPTMTAIGQPQPVGGSRQIPTRQLRLAPGLNTGANKAQPQTQPQVQPQVQPTPAQIRQSEEASILQQILMEKTRAENPDHPPLPPTELSDELGTSPPAFPGQ